MSVPPNRSAQVDAAALALLDERARVVRAELLELRDDLASVQSLKSIAVSEQLEAAALKVELISKTALETLAALADEDRLAVAEDVAQSRELISRTTAAVALARKERTRLVLMRVVLADDPGPDTRLVERALERAVQGLDPGVPESGWVLRLGVRSFVVLLPNVRKSLEPKAVRDHLVADLRESAQGAGGLQVTGIGISALMSDAEDARQLLGRAYTASAADGELARAPKPDATLHEDLVQANEQLVLASLNAQKSEAQAKELQSKQIHFMAMVAHELRNPLHPIRAATNLLERARTDVSLLEKLQGVIERQVVQMSRLIEDLIDGSRIGLGTMQLARGPVAIVEMLSHAAEAFRPTIEARGQRLELVLPEDEVILHGDQARLQQVFANLVDNASKYTHEGGRIGIEVALSGTDVVVSVTDEGIGMSPEMLTKVFDLFVQDPKGRAHAHGGLGIGLAVVRELVEAHGGAVIAESAGVSRGSRFVVTLPLG